VSYRGLWCLQISGCTLVGLPSGIWMGASKFANGALMVMLSADCRISIDKPEEPVDNAKNILTPFDAGFSFPKPEATDNRILIEFVSI